MAQIKLSTESGPRVVAGPQRETEAQAKEDYLQLKEAAPGGVAGVLKVRQELCEADQDANLQEFIRPIRERWGMPADLAEGSAKMEKWALSEIEVPGSEELLGALRAFHACVNRPEQSDLLPDVDASVASSDDQQS